MEHHKQTTSPGFTRRRFLQLGLGAAVLPGLGALSGCAQSQPLKVAVQPWCGYQFLFVARVEGWQDTKQVELVDTALTTESVAALREGRVDAAALTLDEVLLLRSQGHPLHVVMVFDASAGADLLLATPGCRASRANASAWKIPGSASSCCTRCCRPPGCSRRRSRS